MEQILRDSFTGLPFYAPIIGVLCFAGLLLCLILFTLIMKDLFQPKFDSLMNRMWL